MLKTSKLVKKNDGDHGIVVPFFKKFTTNVMRADLAFEMVKVAMIAESYNLYAEFLFDPEMWYWVETENTASVHFAG